MSVSNRLRHELNNGSYIGKVEGLGTQLDQNLNSTTLVWDFAKQGGAVGSINLLEDVNDLDSVVKLAAGDVVKQVTVDVVTAMASAGGTGTIALSSEGSGDLLAAVDADTLSGLVAGIPLGAVANMVQMTAERTLRLEIGTEALTAGKINVHVEFYKRK